MIEQAVNQKTVYVGLSGGVDSAVSAYLLVQAGYNVVGIFMKNFSKMIMTNGEYTPCWTPEWRDALRVAAHLKIPLQRWDFEEQYRSEVYDYFTREYAAGRTPNPDVLCNSKIKFGAFYRAAREAGADYIATGHYAQTDGTGRLLRAVDEDKDQTYFLHAVSRESIEHTLFPIGHLKKAEVRQLAHDVGLPVADKKDSTGICFVGEVPIKELLAEYVQPVAGAIVTTGGEVVGQHDGLLWYTIGQRHGFGGGGRAPLYVVRKENETNTLVVGEEHDPALLTTEVHAADARWINEPRDGDVLHARFRHRQPLQEVTRWTHAGDRFVLHMRDPQRAITPGQFAVVYRGDECLGGGVII